MQLIQIVFGQRTGSGTAGVLPPISALRPGRQEVLVHPVSHRRRRCYFQPCCLRFARHPAPPQNWHARNAQRTSRRQRAGKRRSDHHHRIRQHTHAHLVYAPTRITDNMAPSFEQLDPEQAEYDGEEEIDFSGTPQPPHQTHARRNGDTDNAQIFASSTRSAWRRVSTLLL